MTIKEIIKISATLLGRENVVKYLKDECVVDNNTLRQVNDLTECANLVINELACTYVPMLKKEECMVRNGKIYYTELSEKPLKIISVKDEFEKELNFTLHHEYVQLNGTKAYVEYSFVPTIYGLEEEIGYSEAKVSIRTLAYGTVSEYCLIERAFDDAVVWHCKYMDAVKEICMPKNAHLASRRFV